jgi:hypothetical protein
MIHNVIVGNIGAVYSGCSGSEALQNYLDFVDKSKTDTGKAAGEAVVWLQDGEIFKEHCPPDPDGPTPGTYFKVWVELEMVNDALDQYKTMALGFTATADFKREADALKFAHALHACGKEGLKPLMPEEVFHE